MKRAILGTVLGAVLGAVLALPVWWVTTLTEYAELKRLDANRGIPAEQGIALGDMVRTSQLMHFVITMAGFGGTIGTGLGATSAILRALRGPDGEPQG